jgi:flagellar hook assembly protein FlgD
MGPFQLDVEHNTKGDSISVVWSIQNSNGATVHSNQWIGVADDSVVNSDPWTGRGNSGNILPAGWYVARVEITRLSDGQSVKAAERIILLN